MFKPKSNPQMERYEKEAQEAFDKGDLDKAKRIAEKLLPHSSNGAPLHPHRSELGRRQRARSAGLLRQNDTGRSRRGQEAVRGPAHRSVPVTTFGVMLFPKRAPPHHRRGRRAGARGVPLPRGPHDARAGIGISTGPRGQAAPPLAPVVAKPTDVPTIPAAPATPAALADAAEPPRANPNLDSLMDEANHAYDHGEPRRRQGDRAQGARAGTGQRPDAARDGVGVVPG